MNFANMEQYKQTGDNGDFYEFKFEWEERKDEIPFFNFESGPSDFSWKQKKHFLEVEDEIIETWDHIGHNSRLTLRVFLKFNDYYKFFNLSTESR